MYKDKQPSLSHYPSYKRAGKRLQKVREAVDDLDVCPIRGIIRNAIKAEKAKKYHVAIRGWAEILNYLQPKFKAIDPLEQAEKAQKLSLNELAELKKAVMNGEPLAIEQEHVMPPIIEIQEEKAEALL